MNEPQVTAAWITAGLAVAGALATALFNFFGGRNQLKEQKQQAKDQAERADRQFEGQKQEAKNQAFRAERQLRQQEDQFRRQLESQAEELEAAARQFRESQQLEMTRLLTERFGRAAEQIGSDKPAVRLAGAYAMAALADEWEQQRQRCADVLCAYLRLPAHAEEGEEIVRATIERLIFDRLASVASPGWRTVDIDLRGVTLRGDVNLVYSDISGRLDFANAVFTGSALFVGASFGGDVCFQGAQFHDAAVFDTASFDADVVFAGAVFCQSAAFGGSIFRTGERALRPQAQRVDFQAAQFPSGSETVFTGVSFETPVSFRLARFGALDMSRANLTEWVDFTDAHFAGEVKFSATVFEGGAAFDAAEFFGVAHFGSALMGSQGQRSRASFRDAEFHSTAAFGGSTLVGADFREACFDGTAWFTDVVFENDTSFIKTAFGGDAHFGRARFLGHVRYFAATFEARAEFAQALFSKSVYFRDAIVTKAIDLTSTGAEVGTSPIFVLPDGTESAAPRILSATLGDSA